MDVPWTVDILDRCYKDIKDGNDVFTDENNDPLITHNFPYLVTCHDPMVHPAMCNWGLTYSVFHKNVFFLHTNFYITYI